MLTAALLRYSTTRIVKCSPLNTMMRATMTSQMDEAQWKYYQRNWAKDRPTSPWTVYKPQITSGLSLMHRITGVAVYGGIGAAALGLMVLPHNFPYYVEWIQALNIHPHVMSTLKFIISAPLVFHTLNGIRHLAWDVGKGFELPAVYITGYLVIGLTILSSLYIAFKF